MKTEIQTVPANNPNAVFPTTDSSLYTLLLPLAYSIAAVIVLAGIGAFLGQLFRLGKD